MRFHTDPPRDCFPLLPAQLERHSRLDLERARRYEMRAAIRRKKVVQSDLVSNGGHQVKALAPRQLDWRQGTHRRDQRLSRSEQQTT